MSNWKPLPPGLVAVLIFPMNTYLLPSLYVQLYVLVAVILVATLIWVANDQLTKRKRLRTIRHRNAAVTSNLLIFQNSRFQMETQN